MTLFFEKLFQVVFYVLTYIFLKVSIQSHLLAPKFGKIRTTFSKDIIFSHKSIPLHYPLIKPKLPSPLYFCKAIFARELKIDTIHHWKSYDVTKMINIDETLETVNIRTLPATCHYKKYASLEDQW